MATLVGLIDRTRALPAWPSCSRSPRCSAAARGRSPARAGRAAADVGEPHTHTRADPVHLGGSPAAGVRGADRQRPAHPADIRYATPHNFVGRPITGYREPICLLTRQAAEALHRVQDARWPAGYSLKVYDCYRPHTAVDDFVHWAEDPTTSG